jgi:hypothetical protein
VTSNYEINKPKMVEIQIYWKNTFYQWLEILIVIKEKLTLKKINAECVFCIFGVSYGVLFCIINIKCQTILYWLIDLIGWLIYSLVFNANSSNVFSYFD